MRFSLSDDVIDDDDGDSQVDVEPSHPLGFVSPYGKTWISLDPPTPSAVKAAIGRTTYGLFDSDSEDEDDDRKENRYVQSFPPLSSYVRAETAPTSALLSAERDSKSQNKAKSHPRFPSQQQEDDDLYYSGDDEDENDQDNNVVRQLMSLPTRTVAPEIPTAIQEALSSPPPGQRSETQRNIQSKVEEERRRIDEECRSNTEALKQLVMKTEKEADVILNKKQAYEAQLKREQAVRDEQERKEQEARDAQAAKAEQDKKRQEELRQQQDAQQQQAHAAAEQRSREQAELAKKKTEHVDRAKKLVRQLAQLRQSIQPFDENKAVSKRRLGMKKIARGKLNTLSESAQKVQEVATEVGQAITVMREDDRKVAEGIKRGEQGLTQDMTRGKRYFTDLLASNAMSRVQAETFNGIKGDAFPLSAMLAMISVENKDLNPVLEAHIYTVCPTAIPVLPAPKHDATEDEVMTELGMQKKTNGEFESFPQFLARTENIISFMADVMSSVPSTHTLLKGNHGAIVWLERFLDLLPPAPTAPLPLITAPVLGAFLNGAGHMLANKHADAFKTLLSVITDDIVKRLDEGEIGKPSATRLIKILAEGFEHFRTELPAKAIPELYYGASTESKRHADGSVFGGTIGQEEKAQPSQHSSGPSQNPFGGASQQSPSPFGGQSPFGGPSQQNQSPFGGKTPQQGQGFGGGSQTSKKKGPCKFFAQGNCRNGNNCQFSHEKGNDAPSSVGGGFESAPTPNPFGSATSSSFSASPSISTSSFGTGSTAGNTIGASSSPFGSGSSTAAPFGNAAAPSNTSPFSNNAPQQSGFSSSNQSPFSSNQPTAQQSPFSAPGNSNPSPFGGGSATTSSFGAGTTSQPFGSSTTTNPSRFSGGSSAITSPFGGGSNATTSPFGGATNNAAPSPFSNQNQSPFGKVSQPFGPGGNSNPSPFGGGAAPSPSPFSSAQSSSFGSANTSQPFGASANANPSPFGGNASQGFGSSANANPSPFSGSTPFGGSSGFGGNSQQNQGFGGNSWQNQGFGGNKGNSKQPCKFFAQGRCRNGANCRYSHDTNAGDNSGGFGGGSNSGFGGGTTGGFGGSSNSPFGSGSSGFGGGGGFGSVGGFGQNTPFGGPRR